MRDRSLSSRPLLLLAVLFAVATAVYSCIWIYYIRLLPQSTIGVAFRPFSLQRKQLELVRVSPGSPAERAGLRPGGRIVEINGRPLDNLDPWVDSVLRGKPGSTVAVMVESGSGGRVRRDISLPVLPPELVRPTPFTRVFHHPALPGDFYTPATRGESAASRSAGSLLH